MGNCSVTRKTQLDESTKTTGMREKESELKFREDSLAVWGLAPPDINTVITIKSEDRYGPAGE